MMPRPRQRTLYMSSHRPPVYGRDLSTHLKCVAITFIAGLCVCAPLGANPGRYKYTADLLRLDQLRPQSKRPTSFQLHPISSPLTARLTTWRSRLAAHPDREFANYIIEGLEGGFRIGFDDSHPLTPSRKNMQSATLHPEIVERYLYGELAEGRIIGPLSSADGIHTSRIGVIPKGHTPGKWRLITDLSSPEGTSVNDGIDPSLCSLQYTSVDRIASVAGRWGPGSLLAKVDIKSAYRIIPVHSDDQPLLGVSWQGQCYVDTMLPFGLRSAPKIFTAVADALEWTIRQHHDVPFIDHYLDDFIVIGPPSSRICADALVALEEECDQLGVPLAPEKKEGPSTAITFLGIRVDTGNGTLSLPPDKLARLREEIDRWLSRRTCRKRELESLVGTLQYAAKVIKPGRSFVRRLIDLLKLARRPDHHIRLNAHVKSDLLWWRAFAEGWNGVAFFPPTSGIELEFASDASGTWGCGAWAGSQWWQHQWPASLQRGIAFKELFAVVMAAAVWGAQWRARRIRGHCDNQAVTDMFRSRTSKEPHIMHLLRCLFFIEAKHQFTMSIVHIAGVDNDLADDLSRNQLPSFLQKAPQAQPLPTPIPPRLPELLLDTASMWTSPNWMRQFMDTVT